MSDMSPEKPPPVSGVVATAPPTTPGSLQAPAREPAWNVALGIVMLVLSAGSLTTGVVAMFVITARSSRWGDAVGWTSDMVVGFALFGTNALLAVLLAVSAVFLTMRRPRAASVLTAWAGFKIVTALGMLVWSVQQAGDEWEPVVFLCILPAAWACSLPVFVLLWFTRPRVRMQVAGWGRSRGAAANVVG